MLSSGESIPVIETARMRLRGHRYEDLPHCVAMWSDPDVTRFIGGKPSSEQQTWVRLLSYIGHWMLIGFGYWLVEDKYSGEFVGEVGLADFKRDIVASMRSVPELGFALVPRFHGKGYATEAALAALAWADVRLRSRTVCMINEKNLPSLRIAEKCGYRVFENDTYNGQPTLFLSRDRQ